MDGDLWGPARDLDFWTALRAGHVPDTERRAVALLARVCDPHRFGLYCMTGQLCAVGNVTSLMYRIRRHHRVIEYDRDGHACGQWCISIGPHAAVPPTDNVVALKNLIEGEEPSFRATGNRGSYFDPFPPAPEGVVDPFAEPMFSLYDVEPQHEGAVRGEIETLERIGAKDLLDFNWAMDEGRHVFDELRAQEALEAEGTRRPGLGYIEQARALMDHGFVQLGPAHVNPNPDEMRDAIARQVQREIERGGLAQPVEQCGDNGTGMNPLYGNNNVGCFDGAAVNIGGFNNAGGAAGVQYVVGRPVDGRGIPLRDGRYARWDPDMENALWRERGFNLAEEIHRFDDALANGQATLDVLERARDVDEALRMLQQREQNLGWTPKDGDVVLLVGCPTHGAQPGGAVRGRWPEVLHIVSANLNPTPDEVRSWAVCGCLRLFDGAVAELRARIEGRYARPMNVPPDDPLLGVAVGAEVVPDEPRATDRIEEAMRVGLDALEVLHHAQSGENAIRLLEHRREMRARDRAEATAPAGGNVAYNGGAYIRRNPPRMGVPVGQVQWGPPDMEPMLPLPHYEGPGIPVVRPLGGGNPRGPWNRVHGVGRPMYRNPEGRVALAL